MDKPTYPPVVLYKFACKMWYVSLQTGKKHNELIGVLANTQHEALHILVTRHSSRNIEINKITIKNDGRFQ